MYSVMSSSATPDYLDGLLCGTGTKPSLAAWTACVLCSAVHPPLDPEGLFSLQHQRYAMAAAWLQVFC